MECLVCCEVCREWVCAPCCAEEVSRRRTLALALFARRARVETKLVAAKHRANLVSERNDRRERQRWKIKKMQQLLEQEQEQAQQAQSARVASARTSLAQYVSDFRIQPSELKLLQQQLATQAQTPLPTAIAGTTTSASASAVAALSRRRLQANPVFTRHLALYQSQLTRKLCQYRVRLVEQLLQLYVVKRKSAHSCTIVGLELMDDPEALFAASLAPRPQPHQPEGDTEGVPEYSGPPGTDPEAVAAALGYIVLVLHMLSCYLSVRLPYTLHFHGSHSYVEFTDELHTRYYLTLLDNANANHFRRALTLLGHDIQFFAEQMAMSSLAGLAGGDNGLNLAPLHLLPNMLKLIETILLQLRQQQHADPHAEHELRLKQAVERQKANQAKALALAQGTTTSTTAPSHPPPAHPPSSVLSSPPLLPMHVSSPSLEQSMRMDSPPFYSEHAHALASLQQLASSTDLRTPLDSPTASPAPSPAPSPTKGRMDGAYGARPPLSHRPPMHGASAHANAAASAAHTAASSSSSSSSSLDRSDLLSPSTFFGLAPNGYFSAEEPRDSVIFGLAPAAHASTGGHTQQRQQHQQAQSPYHVARGLDHVHHSSPSSTSSSPGSARALFEHAQPPSPTTAYLQAGSPLAPSNRSSSSFGASFSPASSPSSSAAASAVAAALSHVHQVFESLPALPLHLHALTSASSSPPPTALPAVSYASEVDVEWDLVDVVTTARTRT